MAQIGSDWGELEYLAKLLGLRTNPIISEQVPLMPMGGATAALMRGARTVPMSLSGRPMIRPDTSIAPARMPVPRGGAGPMGGPTMPNLGRAGIPDTLRGAPPPLPRSPINSAPPPLPTKLDLGPTLVPGGRGMAPRPPLPPRGGGQLDMGGGAAGAADITGRPPINFSTMSGHQNIPLPPPPRGVPSLQAGPMGAPPSISPAPMSRVPPRAGLGLMPPSPMPSAPASAPALAPAPGPGILGSIGRAVGMGAAGAGVGALGVEAMRTKDRLTPRPEALPQEPYAVGRQTPMPELQGEGMMEGPQGRGPANEPRSFDGDTYNIERGDTFYDIASALLGPEAEHEQRLQFALALADQLGIDPKKLQIGTQFNIPGLDSESMAGARGRRPQKRESAADVFSTRGF